MAAVATYCSASEVRCKGPTGDAGAKGDKGDVGDSVVMACVSELDELQVSRFYVAWAPASKVSTPETAAMAANWNKLYKISSNDAFKPCTAIS